MNVPEDEQPAIALKKIWSVKEAVPRVSIDVAMVYVTVLETVRPNSLELEAIIKQTPSCVICMELFIDHQRIIRLACSHYYHKHCFVRWLEINNTCPLCRCPMPIEEDVEEPYGCLMVALSPNPSSLYGC
ncbi:putative transcription factor C2H2 family [Rosa chinensis]|uniref:Putative transcription factor C2H2 family n=1 Tax=Rosa chinensis TaxID=74649 RepID=A0A2P6R9Z9_ROSCH|nr:putative transcription factor C2H2 family [Rosa chinensis]